MNLENVEVGMFVKVVSLDYTHIGESPVEIGDVVEIFGVNTECCSDENTLEVFNQWSISHLDVEPMSTLKDKDTVNKNLPDNVNHPKHYTTDPTGVEAIQLTSMLPCCISNSLKYIWRTGKKDESKQELEKALWYINYSIEHDLPSHINVLSDSMLFQELIERIKQHWSGWKYVFIDGLYWGNQEQMKRAIIGMLEELENV